MKNDLFLRALARQPVERTPVWLMRQAGRYLPEYNATRRKAGNFLALCKNPELACEVTLQPIDRYGLDAAILFSDILTIPDAFGLGLHFVEGEGPRFHKKIESEADVATLPNVQMAEALSYVGDAVALIRQTLNGRVPLIGFSGSPWTLACYMLSGGSSGDDFLMVRKWIYSRPELVLTLIDRIQSAVIDYCDMQVKAGAQTIMLFDSWGGLLADRAFDRFSLANLKTIVGALKQRHPATPVIVFVKGGGQWAERIAGTGCDGIGLDWTSDLSAMRKNIGSRCTLQGNLDPAVLLGDPKHIEAEATRVVDSFGPLESGVGHVFNLGHGISQFTPIDNVSCLVEAVAKASRNQVRQDH